MLVGLEQRIRERRGGPLAGGGSGLGSANMGSLSPFSTMFFIFTKISIFGENFSFFVSLWCPNLRKFHKNKKSVKIDLKRIHKVSAARSLVGLDRKIYFEPGGVPQPESGPLAENWDRNTSQPSWARSLGLLSR